MRTRRLLLRWVLLLWRLGQSPRQFENCRPAGRRYGFNRGDFGWSAYALLISWWLGPLDRSTGDRFQPGIFDQQGLVPVAYAIFALALGIAAGAVLKKTMPAMAATLVGFVGLRLIIAGVVRKHFVSPVKRRTRPCRASTPAIPAAGSSARRPSTEAGIPFPSSRSGASAERPNRARKRASTTASAPTDSSTPMSFNRRAATGSSKASRSRSSA
jgi:hypothetical protein